MNAEAVSRRSKVRAVVASIIVLLIFETAASLSGADAYTFQTLHAFCLKQNCADGKAPAANLLVGASGTIYGTTSGGGEYGNGAVFKLVFNSDTSTWEQRVIYSFCSASGCPDGEAPYGGLIEDAAGNLYGMTQYGGISFEAGTVFELMPNSTRAKWKLKTIYNFCSRSSCADGSQPVGSLTYQGAASGQPYDGISPLYGATESGGVDNQGILFQLSVPPGKSKRREKNMYEFCSTGGSCQDGAFPSAGLIIDPSGDFFGTTFHGGDAGNGTAFELKPNKRRTKWAHSVLHSFGTLANGADGENPTRELVMDSAGNLYGTTVNGGISANCCGTVFKLSRDGASWQLNVLYDFCSQSNCADGENPESSLLVDQQGNLFGTTYAGGAFGGLGTGGVVFELSSGNLQVLHSFCSPGCSDGENPEAGLAQDEMGNLFGTTIAGGGGLNGGTVFQLSR